MLYFWLCVAQQPFCSGKDDGLYEFPGYCNAYYRCSNGETSAHFCPGDQIFTPARNQCLPPVLVPAARIRECTTSPRYLLVMQLHHCLGISVLLYCCYYNFSPISTRADKITRICKCCNSPSVVRKHRPT